MATKKKHGWVLQAENGSFVTGVINESKVIGNADVYPTRAAARFDYYLAGDVIRKVELTKTGKAKKIIPGR